MKQKAEITFEEQEILVLRQSDGSLVEFCPRCQETVRLVTPEVLAALTNGSERELFRLFEAGAVHFVEAKRVYACPSCYAKSIADTAYLGSERSVGQIKVGELLEKIPKTIRRSQK